MASALVPPPKTESGDEKAPGALRRDDSDGSVVGGHASHFALLLASFALAGVLFWRVGHPPSDAPHPARDPGFRVDVNRADAETLQLLPGLGPSIAANVVKRRETAGPFRRIEELEEVRMIGTVLRTRLTPWVTLGDPTAVALPDPLSPPANPKPGGEGGAPR